MDEFLQLKDTDLMNGLKKKNDPTVYGPQQTYFTSKDTK